jgi:integrase
MLSTGMRISEVAGLRNCDIDMEKGIINIDHNLLYYQDTGMKKMTHKVGKTKTKASKRVVVMIDGVKEAFEEQFQWLKDSGITCQCRIKGEPDAPEEWYTDFIFLNRDGFPYHQGTLNKALSKIKKDANIEAYSNPDKKLEILPDFSCHCLRSTFITECARRNIPLQVTMRMVGHSDRKTTMNIYTTVHPDWMTHEMSAMNDMFNSEKK